jgi:chromosome segregation ATPase
MFILQVGTLQCQLAGCGSELSADRSHASELAGLVKERETRLATLQKACEDRRGRLALLSELQGGAGERSSKLLAIQQEKGRDLAELRRHCERLDLEATHAHQELVRLRDAERAAAAGVSAQQAALRHVASQRATVERELERHRDMLLCLVRIYVAEINS